MICTQTFWYTPTNDAANEASLCILLTSKQKKQVHDLLIKLPHFYPIAVKSSFVHPRFQVPEKTLLIYELYIACTLVVFEDFVNPVIRSIKPHTIKSTMSTARWSLLSSNSRTAVLRKSHLAAMKNSCAKRLFKVQEMTILVSSPQVSSSYLVK